mmetsp:Transcript_16212/g.48172  ORF Transcript_16212/g.48172 Transcript_16212/m.48172 type:complete len:187 (-) Transcript_16212:145-705(-)|eukprot:CAMPEP_0198540056 /NCGR_PEP_ID=MMETSP1462-20131121/51431_1 /TAXON_ID=1333877 /ORGANISM="Brandtodinium nutriculum, Strain RCC3387" /LENGTH=186 /DNA_ID=CAMNT_0044270141 /DNA_START=68 /DNA_END=628 /DNA_ORIENTATION=+
MAEGCVSMQVCVPDGVAAGDAFTVLTPDGQYLQLTCPEGVDASTPIMFSYIPKADPAPLPPLPPPPGEPGAEAEESMHPDDQRWLEEGMAHAVARQQQLEAAGFVVASELPPVGDWTGNVFPAAIFYVGQNAIVTRSSGEESGCNIVEVFLTALGPQYNVFLGNSEANEPVFKWCSEADLRNYPTS